MWTTDGKIWCLRDGKRFETATVNIGQERYFYRVEELTTQDIEYIRVLAVNQSKGFLRQANEGWVHTFQQVFKSRDAMIAMGISKDNLEELMDLALTNIEEDFHSMIEGESAKYLAKLRAGDIEFLSVEDDRMSFFHFLCVQYLRTKNIKEAILKNMSSIPQLSNINMSGCWSVMRHIFATNMAFSLVTGREKYIPVILRTSGTTKFIAGDQPVINTHAVAAGKGNIPKTTEFYYPVSPDIALLITDDPAQVGTGEWALGNQDVERFNQLIFASSYEQIYASSEAEFDVFVKH